MQHTLHYEHMQAKPLMGLLCVPGVMLQGKKQL